MIDTVGRIFEQEIDDGVIHGATVLAGSIDGDDVRMERPDGTLRPQKQALRHCLDNAVRRLRPCKARTLRRHFGNSPWM